MKYHILTLFPEMIEQGLHTSILGRAINNGYISLETTNIRDFSIFRSGVSRLFPYRSSGLVYGHSYQTD